MRSSSANRCSTRRRRCSATTGSAAGTGAISALELAKLEELDWGSWKARVGADDLELADRNASQILTLRQLLRTTLAAGRRVDLAIETKHPSRHAGKVEAELARGRHDGSSREGWLLRGSGVIERTRASRRSSDLSRNAGDVIGLHAPPESSPTVPSARLS